MGSAGHSGCVTRRGVRRDPAQWAGPISTRERVFCHRGHEVEAQIVLGEKGLSNLEKERIGQFRTSLLGAGTESARRFFCPVFPHIDDLAGAKVSGFDLGHGFTDRGFRNPDAERPPFE